MANVTSTAYEASHVVSPVKAQLKGFTGYNSKASAQFIHVFDMTSVPVTGAVPAVVISVGPLSNFSLDYSFGPRQFDHGIVIANSSTGPTFTAGSADCWFDVQVV